MHYWDFYMYNVFGVTHVIVRDVIEKEEILGNWEEAGYSGNLDKQVVWVGHGC